METAVQGNGKNVIKVLVVSCLTGLVVLTVLAARVSTVKAWFRKLKEGGSDGWR